MANHRDERGEHHPLGLLIGRVEDQHGGRVVAVAVEPNCALERATEPVESFGLLRVLAHSDERRDTIGREVFELIARRRTPLWATYGPRLRLLERPERGAIPHRQTNRESGSDGTRTRDLR